MRIGHGYDVHRYGKDRDYIIGGVKIPCDFGMIAHSDGDVLAHALMDALLGAAGMGDIGKLFPDTDEKYKGADSIKLLCDVCERIALEGFKLEYADCTIVAQSPKMSPYIEKMRETLSSACGVDMSRINVKATTEEKLGFTGAMEGAAAHAVCILDERG